MKNNTSPQGFTLLLILGVVGFLLILLTGVYKVVLFELNDTRDMSHFMKSRTASESGGEIAMLKLKKNGFGYHGNETYDQEGESIMLSKSPLDTNDFNQNRDVFFGYEIDSKSDNYNGVIQPGDFEIIPLFYIEDNGGGGNTTEPIMRVLNGTKESLVWNIIGNVGGISGKGEFNGETITNLKTLNEIGDDIGGGRNNKGFTLEEITMENFLDRSDDNYLTIYNVGDTLIQYNLTTGDTQSFTKPVTIIKSSAKIGEIKQNIDIEIENSKYFDVLKYSIYDY